MTHLSSLLQDLGIPEHAKQLIREAVRKDGEIATLLIERHNAECIGLCVGQPRGRCDSYRSRGRTCPDCPRDWIIDDSRTIAAQEEA